MNEPVPSLFASGLCSKCGLSFNLCICELTPKLSCETEILIIRHYREAGYSSGTAKLIQLAIPTTQIRSRGLPEDLSPEYTEAPGKRSLFLFPTEEAHELSIDFKERFPGPYRLIVPDGSWSQARKIYKREGFFGKVPCVKLSLSSIKESPGEFYLRHAPTPQGLSTLEATARVLGFLEKKSLETELHHWFTLFVHRSLYQRGLACELKPRLNQTRPPLSH